MKRATVAAVVGGVLAAATVFGAIVWVFRDEIKDELNAELLRQASVCDDEIPSMDEFMLVARAAQAGWPIVKARRDLGTLAGDIPYAIVETEFGAVRLQTTDDGDPSFRVVSVSDKEAILCDRDLPEVLREPGISYSTFQRWGRRYYFGNRAS